MRLVRITFFSLLMLSAVSVRANEFVENFDSVPLVAGFDVNMEEGFAFDKPEGRVASASAYGKGNPQYVMAYYHRVLPDFGWQEVKPYLFLRDGEYLMIETTKMSELTMIVFLNFPKID